MRHPMSLQSRRELLASTSPRYQQAFKNEKGTILDEFTAATGYHRKYALTLLKHCDTQSVQPARRPRKSPPRIYTPEVQAALVEVWEAANCICSKRLVPFLPELVDALERHGHLSLSEDVRERLLAISTATQCSPHWTVRSTVCWPTYGAASSPMVAAPPDRVAFSSTTCRCAHLPNGTKTAQALSRRTWSPTVAIASTGSSFTRW